MPIICPNCGFKNTELDVYPDHECPQCGIIYNKYNNKGEISQKPETPLSNAPETQDPPIRNLFISIISKTWLWPVPLIVVQLLWLLFNFRKVKDPVVLLLSILICIIVYWLTYTSFFRYAQYASWYTKAPSEEEIGCIVILFRIAMFLGLCFIMYLIISGKAIVS